MRPNEGKDGMGLEGKIGMSLSMGREGKVEWD